MTLDSVRLTLLLTHAQKDTQSWFHSVQSLPEVGSTNTELIQQTQHRNTTGTILLTQHQTQGRGRLGRKWMTPPNEQLAISCAVPISSFGSSHLLPLASGLAVFDAMHDNGIDCGLKWPNDILIQQSGTFGKGVGILVENVSCPSLGGNMAVIGMGINIALSPETKSMISASYPARGLSDILGLETVNAPGFIYTFFAQVVGSLACQLTILQENPSDIITRYNEFCVTVNREILVHCDPRSELGIFAQAYNLGEMRSQENKPVTCIIPAQAVEIAHNGELLVKIAHKQFSINTADIEHIRL